MRTLVAVICVVGLASGPGFADPGLHLLTFRYNQGNNFAYFEFEHSQRE
jgi:hypothetical protein